MTKGRILIIISIITFSLTHAVAQKMVQQKGNLKMLAKETNLLVEYDFSSLDVGKEGSESAFLKKKREDLNKKEAGKGDKYVETWEKNKVDRYEPKFEELINKVLDTKMKVSQTETSAKYKLIVKTLTLYPGFNVGVAKYPAYVSFAFNIVEVANPDVILSSTIVKNVEGSQMMGMDYDAGSRLQESYAKAGKMFGKYIIKNAPLK